MDKNFKDQLQRLKLTLCSKIRIKKMSKTIKIKLSKKYLFSNFQSKLFSSFPLFTTIHKICIGELKPKDLIEQLKLNTSK